MEIQSFAMTAVQICLLEFRVFLVQRVLAEFFLADGTGKSYMDSRSLDLTWSATVATVLSSTATSPPELPIPTTQILRSSNGEASL